MHPPPPDPPPPRDEHTPVPPARTSSGAATPLFRWLVRHVRSLHAALGIYLLAGFAALVATIGLFAWLADEVGEGATQQLDNAVLLWLDAHKSDLATRAALEVTALGSGLVVVMMVLVATAFLWLSRHRYSVLLLWVAVLGGEVLNGVLKTVFDRPRPHLFAWRTTAALSSFPSGHAMTSVVVYLTLAYLLARLEPSRTMRRLTLALAVLLVLGIGWSRLYLGVHYPSDVLAGYAAGLAWSTFCALGMEAVRHFRTRQPEVQQAEHDLQRPVPPVADSL
jgi:undecaprenyl-diphosphatase